jgi:hypothetical protein
VFEVAALLPPRYLAEDAYLPLATVIGPD